MGDALISLDDHLKTWFALYLKDPDKQLPRENWSEQDIRNTFAQRSHQHHDVAHTS